MKKRILAAVVLALSLLLIPKPVFAADGTILFLLTWGGNTPDSTIYIVSSGQATTNIGPSNLYYTISLGSTIYATHTTELDRLEADEPFADFWTTTNTDWPEGDYTITLCWSHGGSHACNLDEPVTTTRHFVPTLGWPLTFLGLSLLLAWLWYHRKDFEPAAVKAKL